MNTRDYIRDNEMKWLHVGGPRHGIIADTCIKQGYSIAHCDPIDRYVLVYDGIAETPAYELALLSVIDAEVTPDRLEHAP